MSQNSKLRVSSPTNEGVYFPCYQPSQNRLRGHITSGGERKGYLETEYTLSRTRTSSSFPINADI